MRCDLELKSLPSDDKLAITFRNLLNICAKMLEKFYVNYLYSSNYGTVKLAYNSILFLFVLYNTDFISIFVIAAFKVMLLFK
jgi:hypothetical protein